MRELFKVEGVVRCCGPKAKCVDGGSTVPNHRAIEGDADQSHGPPWYWAQTASAELDRATEAHFHLLVRAGDLPGVGRTEPVVRHLLLRPILDRLFEDAVFISQSVSHSGELQRGGGFNKACGQTSKTAVSQAGVGLLLQDLDQIQFLVLNELVCERGEQKIHNVVCERATDEKFHRKVVESFGVLLFIRLLCQQPALRQNVAHGPGKRLEPVARGRSRDIDATVEEEVPFIQRFIPSREVHGTTSVLGNKLLGNRCSLLYGVRTHDQLLSNV